MSDIAMEIADDDLSALSAMDVTVLMEVGSPMMETLQV